MVLRRNKRIKNSKQCESDADKDNARKCFSRGKWGDCRPIKLKQNIIRHRFHSERGIETKTNGQKNKKNVNQVFAKSMQEFSFMRIVRENVVQSK